MSQQIKKYFAVKNATADINCLEGRIYYSLGNYGHPRGYIASVDPVFVEVTQHFVSTRTSFSMMMKSKRKLLLQVLKFSAKSFAQMSLNDGRFIEMLKETATENDVELLTDANGDYVEFIPQMKEVF